MRDLDHLESEAAREGADDLADLRVRRLGDHDPLAAGDVLRDVAGIRGHGRAVVARSIRDVHPGQLADRRLVLEDRLQDALRELGLIGRVRGEELASLEHGVDDRGNVVVVDPGSKERDLVDDIAGRELLEMTRELGLRQGRRHLEPPVEADARRDVAEELRDGVGADRREHRLAVLGRERDEAHCVEITSWYEAASRSESASSGSPSLIRTSQPAP